jgi:hypothetical protein
LVKLELPPVFGFAGAPSGFCSAAIGSWLAQVGANKSRQINKLSD